MKAKSIAALWLLVAGFVALSGCEAPSRGSYYYSEYQYSPYRSTPRADFYDPSGDPAYSYEPVYSPIQRPPAYTPGKPAYEYSYYYSSH